MSEWKMLWIGFQDLRLRFAFRNILSPPWTEWGRQEECPFKTQEDGLFLSPKKSLELWDLPLFLKKVEVMKTDAHSAQQGPGSCV